LDRACRGTFESCAKDPILKSGEPKGNSCWRYSFRCQLEEAKLANGLMVQVIEYRTVDDDSHNIFPHRAGNGQLIETLMARDVGMKIFRIYQPGALGDYGICTAPKLFDKRDVEKLMAAIAAWYQGGGIDMKEEDIMGVGAMEHFSRTGDGGWEDGPDWLRR
jgi:hypothetical protein